MSTEALRGLKQLAAWACAFVAIGAGGRLVLAGLGVLEKSPSEGQAVIYGACVLVTAFVACTALGKEEPSRVVRWLTQRRSVRRHG